MSKNKFRFKMKAEDVAITLSIFEFAIKVTDNKEAKDQMLKTWTLLKDQFEKQVGD